MPIYVSIRSKNKSTPACTLRLQCSKYEGMCVCVCASKAIQPKARIKRTIRNCVYRIAWCWCVRYANTKNKKQPTREEHRSHIVRKRSLLTYSAPLSNITKRIARRTNRRDSDYAHTKPLPSLSYYDLIYVLVCVLFTDFQPVYETGRQYAQSEKAVRI